MNLRELFFVDLPLLEIFIRGTLIYLGIFIILRVILKRELGSLGVPDLLMITLIADAAQNGLSGKYGSISTALLLVSTLVFWNFVLDWASSRFKWFEDLVRSKPICLVRQGVIQPRSLKAVSMSRSELMAMLRENEIEKLEDVKAAYLEGDGKLSVIKHSNRP